MITRVTFSCYLFFFFAITNIQAQSSDETKYYVVIGVTTQLANAIKLTEEANLKTFQAQYALNYKKQQYYVFLLQTTDQKKAKSFLSQIRKETEYKKAHLYKGNLGEDQK